MTDHIILNNAKNVLLIILAQKVYR